MRVHQAGGQGGQSHEVIPLHVQANVPVIMQVDKTGRAVKVNDDGFPDVDSLELETDQNQLRYEAYQHMAAQRAKVSPMADDGSADTPPGRSHAWGQGQSSSSSSRTPFADSRPQTDRYTVALWGLHNDFSRNDFLGLYIDFFQGTFLGSWGTNPSCGSVMLLAETEQMFFAKLHA